MKIHFLKFGSQGFLFFSTSHSNYSHEEPLQKKSQKSMCVLTKSTNDLVALEFVFLYTVMVGPNSPSWEDCIVDSSCHKWALKPHSSTGAGWRWAPGPVSLHHKANVPPPLRLFSHLGSGSMSVHSSLLCTHWYFHWRWAINILYCANLAI